MAKTKDFAKFLAEQIGNDEALADDMDRERLNGEIAELIYNERNAARLTQAQLAELAGTHQSVIARLEDAEYNGRTIELLRKILHALGRRLAVSAEPHSDDTVTVNISPSPAPKLWKPNSGSIIQTKTDSAAQVVQ